MNKLLTIEEKNELKERPISISLNTLTPDQFEIRKDIAKKFCEFFLENDDTLTSKHKEIYNKYPMWKFYQTIDDEIPKRSYGVASTKEGKDVLYTATAQIMMVNYTVGGTLCENLKVVDQWTENQIDKINLSENPGMFIDPLGFMIALSDNAQ